MSGQAAFRAGLLEPRCDPPSGLTGPGGNSGADRYAIYRNNVTVALIEALQASFPVVERLVGAKFFRAMAREFVRVHPPETPVMALFGARFPGWLTDFPPVAALPYLPDVAAIEQARRESYHAADAASVAPENLANLAPDALGALHLRPHPSVRVVLSRQPALAIWARNSNHPELSGEPPGEVLICRPESEVRVLPAPNGTCAMLKALGDGVALGRALPTDTDHGALFAVLFAAGALIPEGDLSWRCH